jgi:hypothetical protein
MLGEKARRLCVVLPDPIIRMLQSR